MNEEDPDLLAGDNLDGLRARYPYSPMSERFRLTELLETAKYQNNLLAQKCRELEKERDEARGLYCEYVAAVNEVTPQDIANAHGWGNIKFDRWGVETL